jgi:hypothetical protein
MTWSSQAPAVSPRDSLAAAGLGVVHLVRQANGIEVFQRFLDSYARHPAGVPHELVLVLKGFEDESAIEPYRMLASDVRARCVNVPDVGFDLGTYRGAALELSHRRLVFLNSFSILLADDWLKLLDAPARDPGIGAVAASGSWGSQSSHLRYGLGLGGPYGAVFDDRESTQRVFAELTAEGNGAVHPGRGAIRRSLELGTSIIRQAVAFPSFPSPHLRTNGLLIARERWLRVCRGTPHDKLAAHRLESGRRGITPRLQSNGLRVVVAGRDGRTYRRSEWPQSMTFWQGDQENLLIGDNQTLAYRDGDAHRRRVLSGYAWGAQAAPAEPRRSEAK